MAKAKSIKANDFVSSDKGAHYSVKIGRRVASSLSGFIAGAAVATIIWLTVVYIVKLLS